MFEHSPASIRQIDIAFETLSVPPPYSYAYTFQLRFQAYQQVQVAYELHYTDRDELSEEEIWEEGFTEDDDVRWQGTLPKVWHDTLLEQWATTRWERPEDVGDAADNMLVMATTFVDGSHQEGVPQPQAAWEYLLQELTQAVYEAGQREQPLRIRYLEQRGGGEKVYLSLTAHFFHRSLEVEAGQRPHSQRKAQPWSTLAPLLKDLYLLDYQAEQASQQFPRHPGKYLDPGDGLWYAFGKQVTNPGEHKNYIALIVKKLEDMAR